MMIGAVIAVGVGVMVGALLLADLAPGSSLGAAIPAHVATALVAAGLVGAAAVSGSGALRWIAVGALGGAAALGYRLFTKATASTSRTDVRSSRAPSTSSAPLLVIHGLAATAAIALALLAAIMS